MTEISIYFDFLISILKADGQVEPEERDFIVNSAIALGVSDSFIQEIQHKIAGEDIDLNKIFDEVSKKSDPTFTINLLRDGYSMAKSDGSIDEKELEILKNLIKSFGYYSEEIFDQLLDWCDESLFIKNVGDELVHKVMGVR